MATRTPARAPRRAGAPGRRASREVAGGSKSELFEAVLDAPANPLAILDAERRVVAANRAFRDLDPEVAPSLIRKVMPRIRRGGATATIEIEEAFAKTGYRVYSIIAGRLNFGRDLVSLSIADVTQARQRELSRAALARRLREAESLLRQSEAGLEHNRGELRALAARLMTTQEEERRRVSRELHDDFNQKLAMLEVDADRLCQDLPPGVRIRAQALKSRAAELSNDVRRVAYQLHPSILDHLGLAFALRSYCNEFSAREAIPVKFSARKAPSRPPEHIALCFYRIAQESLRNATRHAHASLIAVTLGAAARGIRLTIRDDGAGFDPEIALHKGGIGLLSMRERARLIDGELKLKSKPGEGTRIDVWAPLG
jgi:signal transduction histidine kinase